MKTRHPKKIFLSRALRPDSLFHRLIDDGHTIIAQSFVKIDFLDFEVEASYDAIFFYSQKAIAHFLSVYPYDPAISYGVMGPGSQATFLQLTGAMPEIIGTGDNLALARQIEKLWAHKTILFPLAKNSMRSLHPLLKSTKAVELVIYKNTPDLNLRIPDCDLYLFTSPLNAKTFLLYHEMKQGHVYAIGATTAVQIKMLSGLSVPYCKHPSMEQLYYLTRSKLQA